MVSWNPVITVEAPVVPISPLTTVLIPCWLSRRHPQSLRKARPLQGVTGAVHMHRRPGCEAPDIVNCQRIACQVLDPGGDRDRVGGS